MCSQEGARTAARAFDRIVVKEDEDKRGRRHGEVAQLLRDAIAAERPDLPCEIVLDEREALECALSAMRSGDVVVMFYDDLEVVREVLAARGESGANAESDTDAMAATKNGKKAARRGRRAVNGTAAVADAAAVAVVDHHPPRRPKGILVIIGGKEDKEGERAILREVVARAQQRSGGGGDHLERLSARSVDRLQRAVQGAQRERRRLARPRGAGRRLR